MKLGVLISIFFFLGIGILSAQTDSLNISWDANTEPDIDRYKLQRSVNSTSNFEDLATVFHPVVQVVDHSIQSGNLYAYRVAAIDSAGNMSPYSMIESAGIPEIQLELSAVTSRQDTVLSLESFLNDPDNDAGELQITVTEENNTTAVVQGGNLVVAPVPQNYTGPASFKIQVEDPDGFWDVKTVSFDFIEPNSTVFIVNIPDVMFDEDMSYEIQMDSTVTISNYSPEDLNWSFSDGANLQHNYNAQSRRLTIQSDDPHWFGQSNMAATATAPDQSAVSDTFSVTVNPVNDPPIAAIQHLYVSGNPDSNIIDLKQYSTDVDNTPQQMTWSFWGYSDFEIQWQNQSANIIRIVPLNSSASETGYFRVADPSNAADTAAVTIEVSGGSPVFSVDVPNAQFDEDEQFYIQMDSTVTISNYSPAQINWDFSAGPDLQYSFDASTRLLMIKSKNANWFGIDRMTAIATAPNQATRVDTFLVTINSVNDVPQATIQNLFISPNSNNLYDLKIYASDADHSQEELNWDFWGYSQFTIEWYNQTQKIIRITPNGNASSENGFFRVFDPEGAADTSEVSITYVEDNTPPHLSLQNTLFIAEDSSITLNLVDFVVDSTNTMSELTWEFDVGAHLNVQHNSTTHTLLIQPYHNWFGESFITFIVRDPLGLSDQQQVAVQVDNRNDLQIFTIQNTGEGQVTVHLKTELPSVVDVSYWYDLSQIITISMTDYAEEHNVALTNLTPDTTYHLTAKIHDESGNMISVEDTVFYAGTGAITLKNTGLIVYPNPVKPSKGHTEMIFANIPEETRSISLYSIMGERVFKEELSQTEPLHRINVMHNRAELPSGLYIYMLKDEGAKVLETGKIVVIR